MCRAMACGEASRLSASAMAFFNLIPRQSGEVKFRHRLRGAAGENQRRRICLGRRDRGFAVTRRAPVTESIARGG